MKIIAKKFNFPTSIAFDEAGDLYVAESGLPFAGAAPGGCIWRVEKDGTKTCLLKNLRAPVNGLAFYKGYFYISEGGFPGRISRWKPGQEPEVLVDNLPGKGNYHTNMVAIGPDEKIYFSQGAMTNSGVVGLDAFELQWLKQLPHPFDKPGYDIVVSGQQFETIDPFDATNMETIKTGAFAPFGHSQTAGQRIKAEFPCTASIMRCDLDGGNLELVAWGIRNAYGLAFLPDGRLLATDQGADDRGSRPIGQMPDYLFEIKKDAWYGWPDFAGGVPVSDKRFEPVRGEQAAFILENHHELPAPEQPLLEFAVNAAATKFDVAPEAYGGFGGHLFVALFGDEKPMTAVPGAKVGRSIARIDTDTWTIHALDLGKFNRPIDIKFHPQTQDMYVLDFGLFEMKEKGMTAQKESGAVIRISKETLQAQAQLMATASA